MFLTLEKLKKVAEVAKIEVKKIEEEFFLTKVNEELSILDMILEVDTTNYTPMVNPNESTQLEEHKDEVNDGNNIEDLMNNAPESLYNYFAVPKVIKQMEE
ncbi:Asp-tRNA(Asn)/Glu-tRNA(Gln) amidotransferase subunit GatC [Pseudomonadota bacterium]